MNAERRKQIAEAREKIEAGKTILESVRDDEQSAFDNMPEGLQQGERGQAMEESITDLEGAISGAEQSISDLDNIQ